VQFTVLRDEETITSVSASKKVLLRRLTTMEGIARVLMAI
jgi:hypothetical protein